MFNQEIHNRINLILFSALAFLMPLNRMFSSYVIAFLVMNWLLEARFKKRFLALVRSYHKLDTILFAGIFILYIIGMLYTRDKAEGWFSIQVKLSMAIFPLLFATVDATFWNFKRVRIPLYTFVGGSLLSSLICLGLAIHGYIDTNNPDLFYYIELSYFHHPGYMAMYICFAVAILISFMIEGSLLKGRGWITKIIPGIVILYFSIFVVLLSSKAGIITLVLIFFLSVSYIIFVQRKYLKGLVLIVLISLALTLIMNLFPYSASRFSIAGSAVGQDEMISDSTTEGTVERILIWKYSLELMDKNFFFGVGTGDVTDALVQLYNDKEFVDAKEKRLNAHNQYIQTFLALGMAGFMVLLLTLLLPAIFSVMRKKFIYFCFLVIIGFNFLIESMLLRQAGVVFYSFFNAFLFAFYYLPGKDLKDRK